MIKKDNTINLDVKSNLAKLLATENITIQHNNVKTASFDVKNRVLTLPIFKQKSGDVYDMLIAHECAHALWTPYEEWQNITDKELRSYVNVIEDTRIDKLIQAKYPGVVRNYQNGFDILEKQNFFGISGRDINKDFMVIDKINLRSKSLNRLPFIFSSKDKDWLVKVDAVKSFNDVLTLAKEMLDWQKDQVEQMTKLPDFDNHIISKNYELSDDEDDFDDEDSDDSQGDNSGADQNDDDADEKNDFNNFGDEKADDEKDSKQDGQSESDDTTKEEDKKGEATHHAKGAGGDDKPRLLKAITDDSFVQNQDKLLDNSNKGYRYGKVPIPNLKDGSALTSYKTWLKDMNDYRVKQKQYHNVAKYDTYLDTQYKKFMNENKKTVMYLVKEFEMKKSAQAYKRASQDKTGIIDTLKLPSYKYSDDIFKKLTIIPDGKNHGMMMLLDWSGSMADCLYDTVKQLINLVEFCKKVNIPFEVYFFTSERKYNREYDASPTSWSQNSGEFAFEDFNLVNCVSHRMNKKTIDLAMKTLFHMGMYFDNRYTRRTTWQEQSDDYYAQSESWGIPSEYYLGNTPLNESLVYINTLLPMFKKKYDIEKMTFITLTDGAGNYVKSDIHGGERHDYEKTTVYQIDNKKFAQDGNITTNLLNHIKKQHDVNVIGFYIVKKIRRWDIERYIGEYKDWNDKEKKISLFRKELTKNKAAACTSEGYNKFFVIDGKKMNVENFDMSKETVKKGTASELKRIFGKSMANRLVSRVILNKFIQEVA